MAHLVEPDARLRAELSLPLVPSVPNLKWHSQAQDGSTVPITADGTGSHGGKVGDDLVQVVGISIGSVPECQNQEFPDVCHVPRSHH